LFPKGPGGLFTIIEVVFLGTDYLIVFVTFTGDEYDIARFGETDRETYRLPARFHAQESPLREPSGKVGGCILPDAEGKYSRPHLGDN